MTKTNQGLPIPGYKPQSDAAIAAVTGLKQAEERVLRALDAIAADAEIAADPRWFAVGRRHIEQGFMETNRCIFKPGRAALPEDAE